MKKQMTIAYDVHSGLYLNLTNRCPCACTFCLRQTGPWTVWAIPADCGWSMSHPMRK